MIKKSKYKINPKIIFIFLLFLTSCSDVATLRNLSKTDIPFFSSAPVVVDPAVFWVSQPVHPNETILVTHGNIQPKDKNLKIEMAQLADTDPGSPLQDLSNIIAPTPTPIAAKMTTDRSMMVTVPASWSAGVYDLQITTSSGKTTQLVNKPDPWFVQGDQGETASPGGFFIVAGNSLERPGGVTPQAALVQDGILIRKLSLSDRLTTSTGYALKFSVPANLGEGDYELYLHNGRGGPNAWVKYTTFIEYNIDQVKVRNVTPWPSAQVNVALQAGANDDERFSNAIAALTALGGGILYVPAGTYNLTQTLVLPNHTVLAGANKATTELNWIAIPSSTLAPDGIPLIRGVNQQGYTSRRHTFSIEDISIKALSSFEGVFIDRQFTTDLGWIKRVATHSTAKKIVKSIYLRQTSNTIMEGLELDTRNGIWARDGIHFLSLTQSTVHWSGRSINLSGNSHNFLIYNNIFNIRGIEVENAWVPDDNPGFWYTCFSAEKGPYIRDLLWAKNTSTRDDTQAPPNYLGYTGDGAQGFFLGKLQGIDGLRVYLKGNMRLAVNSLGDPITYSATGGIIQILDGKGAGQWRYITQGARGDTSITIDRPWTIPPDETSSVTIVNLQGRMLQIDNDMAQEPMLSDYYLSLDTIRAGNTIGVTDRNLAMSSWAGVHYQGTHPNWHRQILGNRITRGNNLLFTDGVIFRTPDYTGIVGAAHVYRNNTNATGNPFTLRFQSNDGPLADVLIEKNQFSDIKMKNKSNETMSYSGFYMRNNVSATGTKSILSPVGVPGIQTTED